jgi:hypothetical protein
MSQSCHKPTNAPHQIIHTSNPITSSSDEDRRLASIRVADFTKWPDARRRQRRYAHYLPGGKARARRELACCRANMGMLPKGLRLRVALLLISMRGRNPVRRSAGEKETRAEGGKGERRCIAWRGEAAASRPFIALAQVSTQRPLIAILLGGSQAASQHNRNALRQSSQWLNSQVLCIPGCISPL